MTERAQRRPEVFDPITLENNPKWSLEYGVPFDTLTYVSDSTFVEEGEEEGLNAPGRIRAMDEVEKLIGTGATTAFVVRRPMLGRPSEYECVVFKANYPKERRH